MQHQMPLQFLEYRQQFQTNACRREQLGDSIYHASNRLASRVEQQELWQK